MIDWAFIAELEGRRLSGYVPEENGVPLGKSGVTVAAGVDLGQMTRDQIAALGLGVDLTQRLQRYAGLRGYMAEDRLREAPLRLSPDEAGALEEKVRAGIIAELAALYDGPASIAGVERFHDLSDACQTVLASVAFQYGAHLGSRCPRFWRLAVVGGWPEVADELEHFGDAYPTRRRKEAAYLRRGLGLAA